MVVAVGVSRPQTLKPVELIGVAEWQGSVDVFDSPRPCVSSAFTQWPKKNDVAVLTKDNASVLNCLGAGNTAVT